MNWLPVKGYEGIYVINELREVKSLMYGRILPVKATIHGDRVTLNKKCISKYRYIADLMKEVFK
jgi:hypothetical protein